MSDAFLERIGEIAVASAWLEDLLEEFIQALCGTEKAAVFTKRMSFATKCDKILDLLVFVVDPLYAADVRGWVKECRAVAQRRNEAVHSRHFPTDDGYWRRLKGDSQTEVSLETLAAISDQIALLHSRGLGFIGGRTALHHEVEVEEARMNAAHESTVNADE